MWRQQSRHNSDVKIQVACIFHYRRRMYFVFTIIVYVHQITDIFVKLLQVCKMTEKRCKV